MKLNEFIKELENISHRVDNPDKVEIQMADCVSVVRPILKEGTVFITDIDPNISSVDNHKNRLSRYL